MARSRNKNNRRNDDNGGSLPRTPTKAILKKQKTASTPTRAGANDAKMSSGEDNDPNLNENIMSAVDDNGSDPRRKNKTREESVKTNLGGGSSA